MIILGLDPLSTRPGAALIRDGVIVGTRLGVPPEREGRRSMREELLPAVVALLAEAAITLDQVNGAGVIIGPGSMTGIRIGIATLRGLLIGRAIPVHPVSTFDVIEAAAPGALPAIQVRKNEWYVRIDGHPCVMTPNAMDAMGETITFASSAPLPLLIRARTYFIPDGLAASVARLTASAVAGGRAIPADRIEAEYLANTYAA